MSVFMPIPCGFIIKALQYSLKLRLVGSPAVLLLFRIVLAILRLCCPYKVENCLSKSVKNCVGMFVGISLTLRVLFDKMAIFAMLILVIREHGNSLHLLILASISLLDLNFNHTSL